MHLCGFTCLHIRVSFDTRGLPGPRPKRSWGQMCSACFARSHDISERSDLDRWHLWSRINPWTMQLPETQSNELSLNKNPHKSSHVDVIHHCLWACGLIPLMWIGFQESLSQFLRWWSHRKVSTAAVSPSCRWNRSTVQRVQRQIRWRRLCRRRSGAQTEENLLRFCDILWSLVQHVRGDVRRCKMKYVKCGYTRYKPHRILINSPCAYQSAAWKESKPLELPKCSNGTLELESGTYKALEKRGKCWLGGWVCCKV